MKKENVFKRFIRNIYRFFSSNYLFKDKTLNKKNVFGLLLSDSREQAFIISLLLLALQSFYIIKDIITDFIHVQQVPYINIIAEIVLFFSSLVVLILSILNVKKHNLRFNRFMLFIYYLCIVVGMNFYMYGDLYRHPESFSVAFFYLIIFAVAPCPYFIDNLIIFIILIVGSILNSFILINVKEGAFQYLVITVMFAFIALYLRNKNIKLKISNLKENEMKKQLLLETFIDPLTTSLNRRGLDSYLKNNFDEWRICEENVGIVMFDIDFFKEYNDTYSHLSGDECLKRIALAAIQTCNNQMSNLFRYGGDEFILFIIDCNEINVLSKTIEIKREIEKLKMDCIKASERNNNKNEYVTISMGCTMLNGKAIKSAEEFIARVDTELYNAKRNGKNCVSFENKIYR